MPIVTDGPTLEPPNKGIDEFHAGRMESLGASASEALSDLPTTQLSGMYQMDSAAGREIDFGELATGMPTPGLAEQNKIAATAPRIDIIDANDRVKKAGLAGHLKLPDQPDIPPAQLEIMMSRAQARREREATIERGPQGVVQSALGVGTSFLVGAVDPINVASAFIPVMGELRYAKLLQSAGEGFGARFAARAGVGAAQGAVGQAALEPLDWFSHTQDGRDFGMSDVLHNIMFGAVLGGAMHAGGGAVSDIYRARKERPMYPYDLGEPLESHTPWEELRTRQQPPPVPRDVLGEYPGIHDPIFPESPDDAYVTLASLTREHRAALPDNPSAAVQTIDDLPQRAKEDAARAGIANLIDGEPLRVGEMLEAAAQTDPRIAESFEPLHSAAPMAVPEGFNEIPIAEAIAKGAAEESPFIAADGKIIGTGGDHLALYNPEEQRAANALRAAIYRDKEGRLVTYVEARDGQRPTIEQMRTVQALTEAPNSRFGFAIKQGDEFGIAHAAKDASPADFVNATRAADARPHRQGRLSDQPGNDNRPSPADALDRDAAWRQLSHAVPDFDEPQAIAASNATQDVKPPPTRLDERLTAAEKADAYAKQMYDLFAERLPPEDRQRLDDLIKTLDDDHEAHSIAIERGAACLFGARG